MCRHTDNPDDAKSDVHKLLNYSDLEKVTSMLGASMVGDCDFAHRRSNVLNGIQELIGADSWILARREMQTLEGHPRADRSVHNLAVTTSFSGIGKGEIMLSQYPIEIQEKLSSLLNRCNNLKGDKGEKVNFYQLSQMPEFFPALRRASLGPVSAVIGYSGRELKVILFCRNQGEPEFSDRDDIVVRLVLGQLNWLLERSWPGFEHELLNTLPTRFSGVLHLLLDGKQRKDIARQLNLSVHTVSDYIKAIYKHFDVHSQGELMCQLGQGGGGFRVREE